MAKEKPGSAYVKLTIRIAKVLKERALEYRDAQEEKLGRRLSLNQIIVDALIDKLVSEGFLPEYVITPTPIDKILDKLSEPE